MKKKLFFIVLLCYLLLFENIVYAKNKINISADQAILMEAKTGRVIYEKNPHEKRPIASITKVMTALIAIEYGKLSDVVTISKEATRAIGSSIYLQEGEKMTLEDLLYGLMLRSGNDAAIAIAEHIGGSEEGFVFLMNQKAMYLGMTNSNFVNPHGLDDDNHYSTAYDIALLMRHAMENETFQKISETKSYLSKNREYRWFNKNKLLTKLYPNSTGGKTGYTKKAGRTLVTTAEKDDVSLIAVTLNAPNDWNDHIALYETFFERLKNRIFEKKGKYKVDLANDEELLAYIEDTVIFPVLDEEIPHLKKKVIISESRDKNTIGKIVFELDDETVFAIPLYRHDSTFRLLMEEVKQIIVNIAGLSEDG